MLHSDMERRWNKPTRDGHSRTRSAAGDEVGDLVGLRVEVVEDTAEMCEDGFPSRDMYIHAYSTLLSSISSSPQPLSLSSKPNIKTYLHIP